MKPWVYIASRGVAAFALLVMVGLPVAAQTVDGRFTTAFVTGGGVGGADRYEVTLQLRAMPAVALGSATLRILFNKDALIPVSRPQVNTRLQAGLDYMTYDYDRLFFSQDPPVFADYSLSSVTMPVRNEVSVNIFLGTTGSGKVLPDTFTDLLTLYFNVLDIRQPAGLVWRVEGSNATEVFQQDNVTAMTLGTFDGEAVVLAAGPGGAEGPLSYTLEANYPNPFNPQTLIQYTLAGPGRAVVKVYDTLGREVATLVDGVQTAGRYEAIFDARDLAAGIYFYRIEAGSFAAVRSMVLLK